MVEVFRRHPWIGFALAGAFVFLVSAFVQSSGNLPDPDSFYHARMAIELRDHGIVRDFPWLTQTILADSFSDHHFLYHVLLIPFVSLPDPLLGMRISAVLFATMAMVVAGLTLRALGVRGAAFATLALTASNPFLFRMNLAKAPSLSILLVLLGFLAAAKGKPILLGIIAFVFVWMYGGWPVLLVTVGGYLVADVIVRRRLRARQNAFLLGMMVFGIIAGHLINPYFPEIFSFEWVQIVQIGIIGFRDQFGVGQEWYPWPPLELFAATGITFLLILAALGSGFIASLAREKREIPHERIIQTAALGILTVVFYILTLKSKRNVEYFVPFATLFAFSAIDCARRWADEGFLRIIKDAFRGWQRGALSLACVTLASLACVLVVRDVLAAKRDFDAGIPVTKYARLSAWLTTNTPTGSILFHNDWDDFPYFFMNNTHNRYLVGLDPAFMYLKNPERFGEWVDITLGKDLQNLGERIPRDFGAQYVFVDRDHDALDAALGRDPLLQLVYEDSEGKIYEVTKVQPSLGQAE